MSDISVVIPTYCDDEFLARLLEKLDHMDVSEIIISDGEKRENLPQNNLFNNPKIRHIKSVLGRGPQIQAGIKAARYDLIWVLHTDSLPAAEAPNDIRTYLSNPKISLLTFSLKFDRAHPLLKLFSWFAKWDSPVSTFGDQGFAFRRADFQKRVRDLSNYPLLEDVVLRSDLQKTGRVKRSPLPIITSARRFEKYGILKTQYLNLKTLFRFSRGHSPKSLYADYYAPSPFEK